MIVDLLLLVAFVVAALWGRRRGFVRPLCTQLGIIALIGVRYLRPDLLAGLLPPGLTGTLIVFGLVTVAGMLQSATSVVTSGAHWPRNPASPLIVDPAERDRRRLPWLTDRLLLVDALVRGDQR